MGHNPYIIRQARLTTGTIVNGVAATNFVLTEDTDGNRIPAKIKIHEVIVKPGVSTIREIMLYGKATRLSNLSTNHSLVYEDTWTGSTTASDAMSVDTTDRSYNDRDTDDQREGSIYGTVRVKALATDSAFAIDIFFSEQ